MPKKGYRKTVLHRNNLSLSVSKTCSTPEYKKYISNRQRKSWADPIVRRRRMRAMHRFHTSKEGKKSHAIVIKKRSLNPSYKKNLLIALNSKEYKLNHSKSIKRTWRGERGAKRRQASADRALARRIKVTCSGCGVEILRKHRNSSGKHFCSAACGIKCNFRLSNCQNKQEKILGHMLKPLGFKYVGAKRSIKIGNKIPDFIHNTRKIVIELFGEYWHKRGSDKPRIKHFSKYGYKCCVIWSRELCDVDTVMGKIQEILQ